MPSHGGFHQLDRRQHVGVERLDPVAAIPIAKIARRRAAGVVDENIRIWTGGENGVSSILRRDISHHGHRFRTGCGTNFIGRMLQDFAAPGDDDELYAFPAKGDRAAPAQTHACRADNRRAAPKTKIHFLPRLIASPIRAAGADARYFY
jgi:hypothetical protein